MLVRALAVLCLLGPMACGGGGGGSGGGGGADGKYHPKGNGDPIAEADACGALATAIQAKFQSLSCVGTTRQCPDFLRAQFGSCLQYDEGTVQGCADYYAMQTSCDALESAISGCVVQPIDGSSGKGCP
jgi:hypothetical protein